MPVVSSVSWIKTAPSATCGALRRLLTPLTPPLPSYSRPPLITAGVRGTGEHLRNLRRGRGRVGAAAHIIRSESSPASIFGGHFLSSSTTYGRSASVSDGSIYQDHRSAQLGSKRGSCRLSAMAASTSDSTAVPPWTAEVERVHGRHAELLAAIHSSPTKAVLVAAGGASQALGWVLSEPGASGTVIESIVPYSTESMTQLLGKVPAQFCSAETASELARAAYKRAVGLTSFGECVVGVAATCGLASAQPKRGDHRVWVATHDGQHTKLYGLKLAKGARGRAAEDAVASQVLLRALADACDVGDGLKPELELLPPSAGCESLTVSEEEGKDALSALLSGEVRSVEFSGGRVFVDAPRPRRVYLSGSFNPLHEGHQKMLATACEMLGDGREGCFELAVCNADKGTLSREVVEERVEQFVSRGIPLVLTMEPIFTGKAAIFPRSTFVVGYDTAVRLVNKKYYKNSEVELARQFAKMEGQGCTFAVAGRLDGDTFKNLEDIEVPDHLASVFALSIPEGSLRVDISSTELRKRRSEQSDA